MKFTVLGRSGLRVSELCLGAMTFGTRTEWGASADESEAVFRAFADAGGNFIDTANSYQEGESERLLGQFVGKARHGYVIASKFTLGGRPGDPNSSGNHRKSIVQAIEGSLRRLNTDYIDLYWMHAWDGVTPVDEVLRALDDLVSAGKVLYIGFSDTPAWVVSRAQLLAEMRGWTSLAAIQLNYNLLERTAERELLPMARELGLSVTVWGALANGLLSGKYLGTPQTSGRLQSATFRGRGMNGPNDAIVERVAQIAAARGVTSAQIALAWIRAQGTMMIPIIGARTADQLKENMPVVEFALSAEDAGSLDELSAIDLGFPASLLARDAMRNMIFSGTRENLVRPFGPRRV